MGLTNGGLSPKFSEKIGGKSGPGKSSLFGADWGLFRGRSGPIPLHLTTTGEEQKLSRTPVPFLAQLAPFGAKPPFAKPPFRFPRHIQEHPTVERLEELNPRTSFRKPFPNLHFMAWFARATWSKHGWVSQWAGCTWQRFADSSGRAVVTGGIWEDKQSTGRTSKEWKGRSARSPNWFTVFYENSFPAVGHSAQESKHGVLYFWWIQEGFAVEPLWHDLDALFRWNFIRRVATQKSELQPESQSYSRMDPQIWIKSPQTGVWIGFW